MARNMKPSNKQPIQIILGMALAGALALACIMLAGCSGGDSSPSSKSTTADGEYPAIDMAAMDFDYSKRDKDASFDSTAATKIELSDSGTNVDGSGAHANGSTVTITQTGTYLVSGTLGNGQLVIDIPDTDKVQVVLDGVNIRNESGPAVYVKQADKCFITLAPGSENALGDGSDYVLESGEDEPNATLFSKDDLTINGSGSLSVTGSYRHAINSKDDLVITGGTFDLQASEDALRGKDCVKVLDGTFDITSGEDAVKSSNDKEANRGFVCIDGGSFTIRAGDDGVHAETVLLVRGGNVDIQACVEGYEAEQIYINDGNTNIIASDDALNASARGSSSTNAPGPGGPGKGVPGNGEQDADNPCLLQINGGTIVLDASGDGVDSNGAIEITGGVLLVSGPTSDGDGALDYELSASITGGTVLMTGSAGMAECFSSAEQAFIFTQATGQANMPVTIANGTGETLITFTPAKPFQMVLTSAPGMTDGSTYSLIIGTESSQVAATTEAQPGMGMGPRGRPGGDMNPGGQAGRRHGDGALA